jgi:hypothetical protein
MLNVVILNVVALNAMAQNAFRVSLIIASKASRLLGHSKLLNSRRFKSCSNIPCKDENGKCKHSSLFCRAVIDEVEQVD